MGQRNKGIHSKDNLNENYFDKRFEFYLEHEMLFILLHQKLAVSHRIILSNINSRRFYYYYNPPEKSLSFNYLKMHE